MKKQFLYLAAVLFFIVASCSKNDDSPQEPIKPLTYTVSTLAGGLAGFANGTLTQAQFNTPGGMAFDSNGNLYIADALNHKIRKITPAGEVSTFAGSTSGFSDGLRGIAKFNAPRGVAVGADGFIYVTDAFNHKIRKISPDGLVSTIAGSTPGFADGLGVLAKFNVPFAIAVDASNNVYVADAENHKIRKISPTGIVSTFAGSTEGYLDADGLNAKFDNPAGLTFDNTGNLLVVENGNSKIRKISPAGVVSTVAGSTNGFADGNGVTAKFDGPVGITIDGNGAIYIVDRNNHRIRKISTTAEVTTIAGNEMRGFLDGKALQAQFNLPEGIAIDANGNLYVTDAFNHKIRKIVID